MENSIIICNIILNVSFENSSINDCLIINHLPISLEFKSKESIIDKRKLLVRSTMSFL